MRPFESASLLTLLAHANDDLFCFQSKQDIEQAIHRFEELKYDYRHAAGPMLLVSF